ncbi:uncharacterized protein LOC144174661 isoform X2 [Haemaphysalis longicornis]
MQGGGMRSTQLQSWPLVSLIPRQGALESLLERSRQRNQNSAASFSLEGDDDGDVALDSQDASRRAKLGGKACYFKICPFNTRALFQPPQ